MIEKRVNPPRRSDDCLQCGIVCHEIAEGEKASEANKKAIATGLETAHKRIDEAEKQHLSVSAFRWAFGVAMTVIILLAGYQGQKMDNISSNMNEIARAMAVLQSEMIGVKRSLDNKLLP
ncbi:MAG TPA: hypothetical protein VJ019_05470 [Aestuariivirga sp.]|nr:hypothetical protein [Aestuariivirga sp.]